MKRSSEFDANLGLAKRAELARSTGCYEADDPVGFFHGMYWAIWFTLVAAAIVTSMTVVI